MKNISKAARMIARSMGTDLTALSKRLAEQKLKAAQDHLQSLEELDEMNQRFASYDVTDEARAQTRARHARGGSLDGAPEAEANPSPKATHPPNETPAVPADPDEARRQLKDALATAQKLVDALKQRLAELDAGDAAVDAVADDVTDGDELDDETDETAKRPAPPAQPRRKLTALSRRVKVQGDPIPFPRR